MNSIILKIESIFYFYLYLLQVLFKLFSFTVEASEKTFCAFKFEFNPTPNLLSSFKAFKLHELQLLQQLQLLITLLLQLHLLLIIPLTINAVIKEIIVYTIAATIKSAVPPSANAVTIKIEKNIPATLSGQFIKLSNIAERIITARGIAKKISKTFI